jgi:hypothetical protein
VPSRAPRGNACVGEAQKVKGHGPLPLEGGPSVISLNDELSIRVHLPHGTTGSGGRSIRQQATPTARTLTSAVRTGSRRHSSGGWFTNSDDDPGQFDSVG